MHIFNIFISSPFWLRFLVLVHFLKILSFQVTTLIDGNSLVETQKGDGFESVISRKKEGDLMIMVSNIQTTQTV